MNLATFQPAVKFWNSIQFASKNSAIGDYCRLMREDNRLQRLLKFLQLVVAAIRGSLNFLTGSANNVPPTLKVVNR